MPQRGLAPRIFDALFARIAEEETRLVRLAYLVWGDYSAKPAQQCLNAMAMTCNDLMN